MKEETKATIRLLPLEGKDPARRLRAWSAASLPGTSPFSAGPTDDAGRCSGPPGGCDRRARCRLSSRACSPSAPARAAVRRGSCGRTCRAAAPKDAADPRAAWYQLRDGSFVSIPGPSAASPVGRLPWTVQSRVADLAFSGDSLYLALNGSGLARLDREDGVPRFAYFPGFSHLPAPDDHCHRAPGRQPRRAPLLQRPPEHGHRRAAPPAGGEPRVVPPGQGGLRFPRPPVPEEEPCLGSRGIRGRVGGRVPARVEAQRSLGDQVHAHPVSPGRQDRGALRPRGVHRCARDPSRAASGILGAPQAAGCVRGRGETGRTPGHRAFHGADGGARPSADVQVCCTLRSRRV